MVITYEYSLFLKMSPKMQTPKKSTTCCRNGRWETRIELADDRQRKKAQHASETEYQRNAWHADGQHRMAAWCAAKDKDQRNTQLAVDCLQSVSHHMQETPRKISNRCEKWLN